MLKKKINEDLKQALREKNASAVSTLRMLLAEIHNREIAKKGELSDEEAMKVLQQEKKKHQDSIAQFSAGERPDLVEKEKAELAVIESYLPEEMGDAELERLVREVIGEIKPAGPADFGKVMKEVLGRAKGAASGQRVSQIVKSLTLQ